MENLEIEKTTQTPTVIFNTDGNFVIRGISTPDNVHKFYQPIFDWVNEFKNSNPSHINFKLEIDYLNTSSTRIMVELLKLLNSFSINNTKINISWAYEDGDDDMRELGEDLMTSSKTEFQFITI